jgi:hypothetical protein
MTDAPERIWVTGIEDQPGPREAYTHWGSWPGRTEYIRADVAAAMVAAEREACAKIGDTHGGPTPKAKFDQGYYAAARQIADAIRKRGQP